MVGTRSSWTVPSRVTDIVGALASRGDRVAVRFGDEVMSAAELAQGARQLAADLAARGTRAGDRIAIVGRNYPEWVVALLGVIEAGAVPVPLNSWWTTAELIEALEHAEPVLVIADDERAAGLQGETTAAVLPPVLAMRGHSDSTWGQTAPAAPASASEQDPDALSILLYTSGTTGRPKGVILTGANLDAALSSSLTRSRTRKEVAGLSETDEAPALVAFPLFHVAGLVVLLCALAGGDPVHLMYKWDSEAARDLIAEHGIQEVFGPPTVIQGLLDTDTGDTRLAALRLTGTGGARATTDLAAAIRSAASDGAQVSYAYGLTETTSTVLSQLVTSAPGTSLGRPLGHVEIRVRDSAGHVVHGPGQPGELEITGPTISPGYFRDPVATSTTFVNGWFRTGDLAEYDADGVVHLVGRLKDVVIRGGENISAAEVEAVLERHPDVVEAAIVARPHAQLGEEVSALVQVRDDSAIQAEDLRRHASGLMAAFKVPSEIVLTRDPLPRNPTGKLNKPDIRESLARTRAKNDTRSTR